MNPYIDAVNSFKLFIIVGLAIFMITLMCLFLLIKSYRAGIKVGMSSSDLKKVIISSASFTVIPSLSILLGVIVLSGSLGIPISWLRLSVVGALQYELNVAQIASNSLGMTGLRVSEMQITYFTTIVMVMTAGIIFGLVINTFFLKKYSLFLKKKSQKSLNTDKKGFGDYAVVAMFIGLCSVYVAASVGDAARNHYYTGLIVTVVSGISMLIFEKIQKNEKFKWVESFSLTLSMLVGMIVAILYSI